jgi:hypothetical protein
LNECASDFEKEGYSKKCDFCSSDLLFHSSSLFLFSINKLGLVPLVEFDHRFWIVISYFIFFFDG